MPQSVKLWKEITTDVSHPAPWGVAHPELTVVARDGVRFDRPQLVAVGNHWDGLDSNHPTGSVWHHNLHVYIINYMYYLYIHVFTYQATIYIDSSVGSTVRTSSLKRTRILISKNIKLCLHLCGLVFFRRSSSVAHGKIRTAGPTLAQDSMSHLCSKRHQECGSLPHLAGGVLLWGRFGLSPS